MIRAYLDNNATTRSDPEVVAAMLPYLSDLYLNPSSAAGVMLGASEPIMRAKRALATLLGVPGLEDHFVLTSGASEANSWAIMSTLADGGLEGTHIIASAIEHPSVLEPIRALGERGCVVDLIGVSADGQVETDAVVRMVGPETRLVSIMLANNETGVLQPVGSIARAVKAIAADAVFHCDATQAIGKVPVDLMEDLDHVDLLSLSAHKFHGPKGIGALFIAPGHALAPMIFGGGQEGGRRGGTWNTPAAAGLAVAADLVFARLNGMGPLRDRRSRLERGLTELWPSARINGSACARLPNTSSVTLPGLDAGDLVDRLASVGVCVAVGSACKAGAAEPSYVLQAMGVSRCDAEATLRLSLSHETTDAELEIFLAELRALLPCCAPT